MKRTAFGATFGTKAAAGRWLTLAMALTVAGCGLGGEAKYRDETAEKYEETRGSILGDDRLRSEEHTSELQSLMRISYAVFCLKKKHDHRPPALRNFTPSPEYRNTRTQHSADHRVNIDTPPCDHQ